MRWSRKTAEACPDVVCCVLILCFLAIGGCAVSDQQTPGAQDDPFRTVNRILHRGNTSIDQHLIEPAADAYDSEKLPAGARRAIQNRVTNFLANLRGPIDISNNFLQGKLKCAFSGVGRLLVNTTLGLGGLFDPASRWGMPRYPEDFGQTLAVWGVPEGPYLVLPLLGPSNLRDLAGLAVDWQIHPVIQYDKDNSTRNGIIILEITHSRSQRSPLVERELETAIDRYSREKSLYEQARRQEIFDGNPPNPDLDSTAFMSARTTATSRSRCSGGN